MEEGRGKREEATFSLVGRIVDESLVFSILHSPFSISLLCVFVARFGVLVDI